MKKLVPVLFLMLGGCVSTEMKSYVGKDIREVVLTNGQPIGILEMGEGAKAFQFMWGGSSQTAITTNRTKQINSDWFGKTSLHSNAGAVTSNGCVIAYITRWDDAKKGWIIFDYKYPNRVVC